MPNAIQFYDDKILFGDSEGNNTDKIAFHEDCCCEGGAGCPLCSDGGPLQFQVVIDGLTNQLCFDCGDLNDTYIVTIASFCLWNCYIVPDICHIGRVNLFLHAQGDPFEYFLTVQLDAVTPVLWAWRISFGETKPTCKTLNNLSLPLFFDPPGSDGCYASPGGVDATCKVTAL